ncbi:uroporphyrinogen III synthase [Saccharomonospora sp. CUA-673]|uniref:uroporphyrinogen-III synthase n=1 Tax=Saccharomonospora sp. CUA-673 TaxID=1904969 RepID=UPI0009629CF4|nr:uroporphyrinogen-III synthase [Saccharomonospora sp. CUA-673]OLT48186.1 uroporphyrinogen III synthase [Saccharomonospora sp. CUA-673]
MADLDGAVIGITAERRADEFIDALNRRGATVWHGPTLHIVPLPDDVRLRAATDEVITRGVDVVAVTTGAGFRGWLSAADDWGTSDALLDRLADARLFVRGPKATGAVRGRGLTEEWSAPEESNRQLFAHIGEQGVAGSRVAVQLHGQALPEFTDPLREAGAQVVEVQPYRWQWPADLSPARRLVDGVLSGEVDALAFTSAPAAANLLRLARDDGRYDALLGKLGGDVLCACVGPVTAAPLVEAGVRVVQPERQRLGALVKLLAAELGAASVDDPA